MTPSGSHSQPLTPHQSHLPPQRFRAPSASTHQLPPLPPLSNNGHYPTNSYGSAPQTPITPNTPTTSAPLNQGRALPTIAPHPPLHASQPSSSYFLSHPTLSNGQSLAGLTTSAHQQNNHAVAPGNMTASLHDIRPMPPGGMGIPYGTSHLLTQPPILPNQEPEPIHVVGQQGRRGVLPATGGRPAPNNKSAQNLTKNADNKYECPHCAKTYLHLKHLKRHLLRHTGERPYQCHLCKDTFSRSDILKRHFQKCSIRRGNPTGQNHLANSQAHLRKNRASQGGSGDHSYLTAVNGTPNYGNGQYGNNMVGGPGFSSESPGNYAESLPPMSARSSRANSLMGPRTDVNGVNGMPDHRRSMTSMDMLHNNRMGFDGAHDFRTGNTIPGALGSEIHNYNMGQAPQNMNQQFNYNNTVPGAHFQNNMGMKQEESNGNPAMFNRASISGMSNVQNGQGNDLGWDNPYHNNGQDAYGIPTSIHPESPTPDGMFGQLYSSASAFPPADSSVFDTWDLSSSDPLQNKADALIAFCFPEGTSMIQPSETSVLEVLRKAVSLENMKSFLTGFSHFQAHWPLIHMPTFNPAEANNGLLLTMICIGAVYSRDQNVLQVRNLMELVKMSVQRSSRLYTIGADSDRLRNTVPSNADIEEVQALLLLQCLFTWHGNSTQRSQAREDFPKVANIVRQIGLLTPVPSGQEGFSVLHQVEDGHQNSNWQWESWVKQEKRSRAMYLAFLLDAAMVVFFNCRAQFDVFEIRLPLPADDAAWEARTANDCANALGLNGQEAQEKRNVAGSRRAKQYEMREVLRVLVQTNSELQPRSTNIYSKFIIIHALHVHMWSALRQAAQSMSLPSSNSGSSGPSTPDMNGEHGSSGTSSAGNSGTQTPTDSVAAQNANQALRIVGFALEKWKRSWDQDTELQYPAHSHAKRAGFCRDGIHFYWLANTIMKRRSREWLNMSADARFIQTFHVLRQIKNWVAGEQTKIGQASGSISEMAESYGMEDLTLDMKLLFTPIHQSAGVAVAQTGAQGNNY
ncbi:hypothetical protein K490DRAFT_32056 [Saccharata proteae CBS 121410]|uniref:C2H2-type domain-containing protein n=1 Tax=Saccharata proteae CBS 121410 TaxID=1314787 RepID=A0A9P4I5L0_9PEZI|nr:hypothetical protein K490DRAFT_32056 [Saccharata proteae CBS 121410]